MHVLLHGFAQTPASWDTVRAHAEHLGDCYAPTLPGHAQDKRPAAPDFDANVARLAQTISDHQAAQTSDSPVHLVGYSLGARLALGLVCTGRIQPVHLTLISGHFGLTSPVECAARAQADAAWQTMLVAQGMPTFLAAWMAQPILHTQRLMPSDAQAARAALDAGALSSAMGGMGLGSMPNFWPALGAIDVPTTLVAGACDAKFVAIMQRAGALLPRAALHVLPDCGHNVLVDAPEALAGLLDAAARAKPGLL